MTKSNSPPKEGELYKVYDIDGKVFEVYYGYYSENERGSVEPLPIFPDFIKNPVYLKNGSPIVSRICPPCECYSPINTNCEDWCGDCKHYLNATDEISVCKCEKRRKI